MWPTRLRTVRHEYACAWSPSSSLSWPLCSFVSYQCKENTCRWQCQLGVLFLRGEGSGGQASRASFLEPGQTSPARLVSHVSEADTADGGTVVRGCLWCPSPLLRRCKLLQFSLCIKNLPCAWAWAQRWVNQSPTSPFPLPSSNLLIPSFHTTFLSLFLSRRVHIPAGRING